MYLQEVLTILAIMLSFVGVVLFPDATIFGLEVRILSTILMMIVMGGMFLKFFGMQLDYYRNFQLTKTERIQTLTFMGILLTGLMSILFTMAVYIYGLVG